MANLLKYLMLDELSLVDRPANAQAMVSLFKRDTSQEEINKMTDEMEAKVKAYMEEKGCGKADIFARRPIGNGASVLMRLYRRY